MQVFFGPFSMAPCGVPTEESVYPFFRLHHVKADKENAKDGDGEEAHG